MNHSHKNACRTPYPRQPALRAGIAMGLGFFLWVAAGLPQPLAAQPDTVLRDRLEAAAASHPTLPAGAFTSVAYSLDLAERLAGGRFAKQVAAHARRAKGWLRELEAGRDPFPKSGGEIVMRGYRSQLSETLQGYAVYLPPDYDPSRKYPVLIAMHGGSANGNLFLGVVLGNNMNWKTYRDHLWDVFEPRWKPDWIVVAPDGFGQVMWRWMGEQDVLDVLADVQRHYSVDDHRIVLSGLSNGGVGAYNIGMRHAWRFSAVIAIAGAPSWVQYAGGRPDPLQLSGLLPLSGLSLAENALNTDFRYFHGRTDTGPMKPRFVEAFGKHIRELGVPFKERWYDAGHDLLYLVHRHGRIYDDLAPLRRKSRPAKAVVVTGDYRAARQHWLEVTRLHAPPALARVAGTVTGSTLALAIDRGCDALALHVADIPFEGDTVRIEVAGREVFAGPKSALGDRFHLVRRDGEFRPGFPDTGSHAKRPGLSGPLADAYYGPTLHVYGTQRPQDEAGLKRAAERGAKGWPLWLWGYRQRVLPDHAVTPALMRDHNLVLYATPGSHALLAQVAEQLPIRVTEQGVSLHRTRKADGQAESELITGAGLGTRFIYPNPLAPARYLVVQAAPDVVSVQAGHNLPDFLPDYVVYDRNSTRKRPRLLYSKRHGPRAMGYFDHRWRLAPSDRGDGGDPSSGSAAGKNHRARARFATWVQDPKAVWEVPRPNACLHRLAKLGVRAIPFTGELRTPVPTPVEVSGLVDGVWFRSTHEERVLVMSCALATRLPVLARIAKRHGTTGIDIMSSYRPTPQGSFHTFGMGLDVLRFWTAKGVLSVLDHFEETPRSPTCEAPRPRTWKGRALLDMACRLHRSKAFSTVLTPNYNKGHRDHFHLDVRPDDPRLFLR